MKKVIFIIIAVLVIVGGVATACILINEDESVEFTPVENRVYTDKELSVEPDTEKYVKMVALDSGNDI